MILALISSPLKALALVAGFAAPVDLGSSIGTAPNFLHAGGGWIASGRVFAQEKRVRISWRHYPNGLYNGLDCGSSQSIPVSSTPLAIDFMADSRAFYAGRKKDGSIVYEVWDVERPTLKIAADGSIEDILFKELKSRTELHGLPVNKLGNPHGCISNRGLANGVLIKFAHSTAVFGLTWKASGEAAMSEVVGLKGSPRLKMNLRVGSGAKHKTIGLVYSLEKWPTTRAWGETMVLLIDADCDGTIDRVIPADAPELLAQGYRDDSLWLVKLGLPVVHEVPLSDKK
ncbi:MAG: hypothetical protein ACI8QC_002299 [Planctomycetota bacterium]|jgi:hypothetical protein